jgi:ribosomal protein S18 acetylase RimI-like enzyme
MDPVASAPQSPGDYAEYFELRWRVLRAPWGEPPSAARDHLENDADHAVVRNGEGHVVGVGRVHMVDEEEAQVRFMGVEETYRGQGVGRALLTFLEEAASRRGARRIVLNSRSNVVGFYEKLGYRVVGDGPTFFETVKHFRMEKALSPPGSNHD